MYRNSESTFFLLFTINYFKNLLQIADCKMYVSYFLLLKGVIYTFLLYHFEVHEMVIKAADLSNDMKYTQS